MLRQEVGPLTDKQQRFVVVLEVVRIEGFVHMWPGLPGRPPEDRHAIARAFVAKAVFELATNRALIERLAADATLRRLCGWERGSQVPSESTFSRAFAAFAAAQVPAHVHAALIAKRLKDNAQGQNRRPHRARCHRDRGAGEADAGRGAQGRSAQTPARPTAQGRGRREETAAPARAAGRHVALRDAGRSSDGLHDRHQAQCEGTHDELDRLQAAHRYGRRRHPGVVPSHLGVGARAPGSDPAGGPREGGDHGDARHQSLRPDGQRLRRTGNPLPKSKALGHVAIIDANPRRAGKAKCEAQALAKRHANYRLAEDIRYNERSGAERVNGAAKDNYGARTVRVRGHAKVYCHPMFGIVVQTAEQPMRLIA